MKTYKRAGLILRPQSDLGLVYEELKKTLLSFEIELVVEKDSAKLLDLDGLEFELLCQKCDFLISLGGDGTLLYTCRQSYPHELPILGINAGNLGFLTLIRQDELKWFFDELAQEKCSIEERMMLEVCFLKNGKCVKKDKAFNDVVLTRLATSSMLKVDAYVKKKLFNSYYGDGVIISTPTGSTAYNLSAGGAIVYPLSNAFILTSICPHSLTQRPLVMPSSFDVEFKSKDSIVVIDGQNSYEMSEYDSIVVSKAKHSAKLFAHKSRDYFDILREKLNWGNV